MAKELWASSPEYIMSFQEARAKDRSKHCALSLLSLPTFSEARRPCLALFEFQNETLEIPSSAELKIPTATVTQEHSKRNVFDLSFGV